MFKSDPSATEFKETARSPTSTTRNDNGRCLRSSSPAIKRPASDMGAQEREDHTSDVDMDKSSIVSESQGSVSGPNPKAKQQDTGSKHEPTPPPDPALNHSHPRSSSQFPSEDTSSAMSDMTIPASSVSTAATSIAPTIASVDLPSIDEQVVQVTVLVQKPLEDNQKGYAVSIKWLNRVRARSSMAAELGKVDKSATEGEIGPVDNSDLAVVIEGSGQLKDERDDLYVPLKPGLQMDEDYIVVPEEAWYQITQWYGVLPNTPIITRYVHNTSTGDIENCQYELSPPIFSLLKLPVSHAGNTQGPKERSVPPPKLLASRHTSFNNWLKQAKRSVGIDLTTKVRVWKILGGLKSSAGSGVLTPIASRSASPAPGANIVASAGDEMVLDLSTFVALEKGSDRELVEVQDQTMNDKYNGHSSIVLAGLGRDEVIVLEEQVNGSADGGQWASDGLKTSLTRFTGSKSGAAAEKALLKASGSGGRSSPAPGVMTRGRQRRDGKTRGITGLANLGNTCYMNSALQCIRSVEELTIYFLNDRYKRDLNSSNVLGYGGEVAKAYGNLLSQIYSDSSSGTFSPTQFKRVIARFAQSFSGYGQQDSQEFLLFLLDGLSEDLSRIKKKPYIEKPDSTDEMVHNPAALKEFADRCWEIYKARNDSVITDLFAGMYKSTVICPVCDKVSIIFDPYTNLTLQLPIENNWSKPIFYFPLNERPIIIEADIDKHASFFALKQYVAKRAGSDPKKLVAAEIYRNKFYKMFDNVTSIAEHGIQGADQVGIYEMEAVPTNYDPNKVRKSQGLTINSDTRREIPDLDSPGADQVLIPLFHRSASPSSIRRPAFFGLPSYLIIPRADAQSEDEILRKVLANVSGMTTYPILETGDEGSPMITPEGSDTVVMTDDDAGSDSRINAESVKGEDGLVDVSMKDISEPPSNSASQSRKRRPSILEPGHKISDNYRRLFDMKVYNSDNDAIPLGWNNLDEGKELVSIAQRVQRRDRQRQSEAVSGSNSSDDELAAAKDDSDGGSEENDSHSGSDSELPSTRSLITGKSSKKSKTYANKNKRTIINGSDASPTTSEGWLVRPGEAIVLDWNPEALDSLFEDGDPSRDEMRGVNTWTQPKYLPDEELKMKRKLRQQRKNNGVALDECLDEFGKMETLSENNAWYCPKCKEHRQANKKFELWKVPDILVIHFKRFSSNRNFRDKLELFVDYPVEGLDLSERVVMNEDGKSMVYDLIGVDNHYGGLGGGHYTAVSQNFYNHQWYDYNDSHVSPRTGTKAIVTHNAYLLFYRRRSDQPLGGPLLSEIVSSSRNHEGGGDSASGSREPSPSGLGEGPLGGSSRNGSSSTFPSTEAGAIHHTGGGGLAPIRHIIHHGHGSTLAAMNPGNDIGEEGLPSYSQVTEMDEGIDMQEGELESNSYATGGWSFQHLGSIDAPHSQLTAVPPSSLDGNDIEGVEKSNFFDPTEENLFGAGDNASTQADGGDRSSIEMSDRDEDFENAPILGVEQNPDEPFGPRGMRESAPPPGVMDEDDDAVQLPVAEIRVTDVDEEDL